MFLTENLAAVPGPADDYWYQPVGLVTASGVSVSPDVAMRLTAVYSCVKVLSETLAQLPLHVYRRTADDGKERAIMHPLYALLHRRPNQWQTSYEWREMMQGHASLRGNGYSEIISAPNGRIMQLVPLHPDRMNIDMLSDTNWRWIYRNMDGSERILTRNEVFHLRGLSSNGIVGMNPIECEREAIGIGLAAQEYGARFYQNDARPGGVIEWEGHFTDAEAISKFRAGFQGSQTGANRHKTAVLENGMKYHELGLRNKDAQYIETRKFTVEDVARIFRVPPHKIGHLERSTNNNIEHQSIEFVTDTMMPWLVRWEQAISRDLIVREEEFFAEFAVDGLLRGDATARGAFYASGINAGWLTRNEVRRKENMNPLPGLDEPLRPLNMDKDNGKPDVEEDDTEDTNGADQNDSRADAIIRNNANRVATKEIEKASAAYKRHLSDEQAWRKWAAEFYEAHADYVAKLMVISHESAADYAANALAELMQATEQETETGDQSICALLDEWEKTKAEQVALLR